MTHLVPIEVLENSDEVHGGFAAWGQSSSERRIERLVRNLGISAFLITSRSRDEGKLNKR